ncbi:MAG: Asp-tRNA(Asn)/Glu-tRNA(Gln) amidotransferase subunit GatA [Desulfocapsaceae bacterium]|jgi:aspartyl-tRNA(Asn)/glutamyl-tRNA(Gln) amidotransferase subunit A|nr:Asp-tRNA(Asn)/Glu-tRNA(Gln) amidotransferase subunit GatA [Desulfocapsaceae bacterium]
MEPYELTISQALEHMSAGELSSTELVQSCLGRIKRLDEVLRAFVSRDEEQALRVARELDDRSSKAKKGRLCGVPLAVKDLICTKGTRTTCGSKILEQFVPPYDATVVEKLKDEEAIIVGKASMDEFAMGSTSETCAFGIPRNPWNTDYIAGGSSGGSAVAVAAGEVLGALGSDTGGSIRQPASLCGFVGMKPTYGRVSRYGLIAFASSLDQIGPLTRDVRDCALMMNSICGYDPKDSTAVTVETDDYSAALIDDMSGVRVGVPREYFVDGLDLEVEKVVMNGVAALQEAGAEIVEVSIPHVQYCVAVYYLIAPAEASSNLARFDGVAYGFRDPDADTLVSMYKDTRSRGFGAEVKRRILIGTYALSSGYYDAYYKKASQVRTLILDDFKAAWNSCDLLISPVTPTPAWKIGAKTDDPLALYLSDILTLSANLAGLPGMSVPGGFSSAGLPIGIQLQGPHFMESSLIRAAYNIEQRLNVDRRIPPITINR